MDNKPDQPPRTIGVSTSLASDQKFSVRQAMQLAGQNYTAGHLRQAEVLLRKILQVRPNHAAALHLLGVIAHQAGKTGMAVKFISKAIAIAPAEALFHSNLGEICRILKRLDEAVAHGEKAVELAPQLATAHSNLGISYYDCKELDKAEACQKMALSLEPGLASALASMAKILLDRDDDESTVTFCRNAIEINPGCIEAYTALGIVLADTQPEAAEMYCRSALALNPGLSKTKDQLGIVLWKMGRIKESIEAFRSALSDQPDNVVMHNHLSMALLLDGQFKEGWAEGEHRFLMEKYRRASKLPWKKRKWDGDFSTTDIVVFVAEPGFGDIFQYIRLVGQVRDKGVRVAVQAPESVRALLDSSGCYDIYYAADQDFDEQTHSWYPMFSLPYLLNISLDSIPSKVPYLSVEQGKIERWKKILPQGKRLIGIAWQGNPNHETTLLQGRSIPLQNFSALAELSDVVLVSLQKQHGLEQLENCTFRDKILTFDEATYPSEPAFLEAAALIQALDMVITSDTSIAHLAGSLAAPVWVGLQYIPDYRWMLGRSDSPWYPSMKLYRQMATQDWASVFMSMRNDLAGEIKGCE